MITTSGDLAAAIQAPIRKIRWRIRFGLTSFGPGGEELDDLYDSSEAVKSISLSRDLPGDLPDSARIAEGKAAAELTVVLATGLNPGTAQRSAAWFFSPDNPLSPNSGWLPQLPIFLDVSAETLGDPEWIRRFTGTIDTVSGTSKGGQVTIRAIDRRLALSDPPILPVIKAEVPAGTVQPGLSATWIIDHVLRQNHFWSTLPLTNNYSNASLAVSLQGSTWPAEGSLFSSYRTVAGAKRAPLFTTDAPNGLALDAEPTLTLSYAMRDDLPVFFDNNEGAMIDLTVKLGSSTTADLVQIYDVLAVSYAKILMVSGQLRVEIRRASGKPIHTINGPSITGSASWHRVAVKVECTSTLITIRWYLDGNQTTTTTASTSTLTSGFVDTAALFGDLPTQAVTVHQLTSSEFGLFTPDDLEEEFTWRAQLEPSLNQLLGTPASSTRDAWTLLGEIAAAELAMIYLDEKGHFHFWNRAHWDTDTSATTGEITVDRDLLNVGNTQTTGQVANRVEVETTPLITTGDVDQWRLSEVIAVAPGESVEFIARISKPIWDVTGITWSMNDVADGSGTPGGTSSAYYDEITPTSIKLHFSHSELTTRYLVDASGQPDFHITGRALETGSGLLAVAEDPGAFGSKLAIKANMWRQILSSSQAIADLLLADMSVRTTVLSNIHARGDMRRQLGDRTRIADTDGIHLDGEYFLTGLDETISSSGYTQTATARAAE